MTTEVTTKPNGSRKIRKILLWTLIPSAGLALLIFFGLPLFLSSSGGTKILLGKINAAVDGQIQMDDFSMGWFKGVQLTNLSYDDSAGTTSVKVQRIETQPSYTSLLSGKVKLGRTVIDHPEVYVKVLPENQADESTSKAEDQPSKEERKPRPAFPVHQVDLELIAGSATIELAGDTPQTVSFTNIASKVQLAEPGGTSTVDVSMEVPNDKQSSTITAKGSVATDKTGWTIKDGSFDVKIENLQLGSLRPLLALAGQDMDAEGQLNADANIEIKGNQVQHVLADAVITDFAQGTGDERIAYKEPVQLHAATQGVGKDLLIERAYVKSQFCQVDCSGSPNQLTYNVNADLEQTQRFVGQFVDTKNMKMSGDLAAKGTVSIQKDTIALKGDGTVQKLIVQKDGATTPQTDARLTYDCTVDQAAGRLQIAAVDLAATPGTVKISNLSVPMSKQGPLTLSLDAQARLDLAQAWSFAKVFADLPEDMTVSGMLDSTVKATTTDSTVRLLIDNTQIDKLKIQQGKDKPFAQNRVSLAGDVLLDMQAKQCDVKKLLVQGDDKQLFEVTKGAVKTQTSETATTVSGDFEVAYDWQTLSAFASGYLPEGLELIGKRTDKLKFKSEYPTDNPELLKANLDANATFGFASAAYNGFNFGPTSMTMTVNKGILDFDIPQATVNEGKFQFAGQVDLNADSKVLRLKKPMQVLEGIHINEQITRTMLARLNPIYADQVDVSGFAALKCDKLEIPFKTDEANKILLDGVIRIDKGQLEPTGFLALVLGEKNIRPVETKLLPTHVIVKDEIASYNSMEFHVGEYPIGFSGKTRFDGYGDLKIALPKRIDVENVKLRSVKVGDDLSERIVVECQGYVQDFGKCIRYDKILQGIMTNDKVIEDLIQRGLEEIFK